MSEVFSGTPVLISVRIDGPEGKMCQYHVAGQDVTSVADAVKKALSDLPSLDDQPKAEKKPRRARRTKVEEAREDAGLTEKKPEPAAGGVWP